MYMDGSNDKKQKMLIRLISTPLPYWSNSAGATDTITKMMPKRMELSHAEMALAFAGDCSIWNVYTLWEG